MLMSYAPLKFLFIRIHNPCQIQCTVKSITLYLGSIEMGPVRSFCLFVWFEALCPSQQIWSCQAGQFT